MSKFQATYKKPFLDGKSKTIAEKPKYIKFNFKDLDPNQGATFDEWEEQELLSKACDTMKCYSNLYMGKCWSKTFRPYPNYPSPSGFEYPRHVPLDAQWARIHIQGKVILVGHIIDDTFYIVFLDSDHTWYITKRRQ